MISQAEYLARFASFQPNPDARLRLFCFPSAGSGVALLHNWLKGLPPYIHVCPIQLPGRENRRLETPFNRMDPLVTQLADALDPYLNLDFAFFGHSLGSLIAFELARELRRRGTPGPLHLFVSARCAPQIEVSVLPIHELPEPQFISQLRNRFNAIPDAILADEDLLKLFVPVLRADLAILETYVYKPEEPLAGSLSVFGGTVDGTVNRDQLEAWRLQASGAFKLRMLPGDHFFPKISRSAFLGAISQDLTTFLIPT